MPSKRPQLGPERRQPGVARERVSGRAPQIIERLHQAALISGEVTDSIGHQVTISRAGLTRRAGC